MSEESDKDLADNLRRIDDRIKNKLIADKKIQEKIINMINELRIEGLEPTVANISKRTRIQTMTVRAVLFTRIEKPNLSILPFRKVAHLPLNLNEKNIIKTAGKMALELGRRPTIPEIARRLGWSYLDTRKRIEASEYKLGAPLREHLGGSFIARGRKRRKV